MELGPFAGLIYAVILIVGCLFFLILEWTMPRENLDYVQMHWDQEHFVEVGCMLDRFSRSCDIIFGVDYREGEEWTAMLPKTFLFTIWASQNYLCQHTYLDETSS